MASSNPNELSKAPSPNNIAMKVLTYELGRKINIQFIISKFTEIDWDQLYNVVLWEESKPES